MLPQVFAAKQLQNAIDNASWKLSSIGYDATFISSVNVPGGSVDGSEDTEGDGASDFQMSESMVSSILVL